MMVACLSPADNNYEETVSTLRYASRAKSIKNKPKINEDPKDSMLREYQSEIEKLKSMLDKAAGGTELMPNEEILEAERQRVRSEYEQEMKEMREKYKSEQQSKAKIQAEMEEMKRQYEEKLQEVNDRAKTATERSHRTSVTKENVVESEEVNKDNEQNEEQKAAMEKLRKLQASLLDGGKRAGDTDLKEKRGILLGNNTTGGSKAVKTPMVHSQEDTDVDLLLQAELAELTLVEEQNLKEIADIRKKKDQIQQNIERLSRQAQAGPNVWTRNRVLCLVAIAFVVLAVFAAKHQDTGRKRPVGGIDRSSGTGYILSSTGKAAEYFGDRLGLYEEVEEPDYVHSKVYRQQGGAYFIYKKNDKWWCGITVGASSGAFYTTELFSQPGDWHYYDGEAWASDDMSIQFLPLTPTSCILQPSILITSTGPANSIRADYLGYFTIVQDVFSAGRPVWRNSKGKVLKIFTESTNFGVCDGIESTSGYVLSGSGPTCPTDTKASHSDRFGRNAWQYGYGGKRVEDATILVQ